MNDFLNTLLSSGVPLLPGATVMRVALYLAWAVVLGCAAMGVAGRWSRRHQWALGALVMAWTLTPGSASPAHWLGLAFQTPSLASVGICLVWCSNRAWQGAGFAGPPAASRFDAPKILGAAAVVLGWVLLLDTLAWLPVSVYAWGFSSAALGAVAVLLTLLWVLSGSGGPVLMLGVLALFVLTRLPTGNVWDALLDPWLWGALQAGWLIGAVRRRRMARRLSPATRA
jgi:hypothetical protein